MPGVEKVVGILYLNHRSRADPSVLPAAAAAFQDGIIIFPVGYKILRGSQIDGMVVGVPALFQVVDIVGSVLIVGHGVSHVRLIDPVHPGPEKDPVIICRFLASRRPERGKILVVLHRGEGFPVILHGGGRRRRSGLLRFLFPLASGQQRARQHKRQKKRQPFPVHDKPPEKQPGEDAVFHPPRRLSDHY